LNGYLALVLIATIALEFGCASHANRSDSDVSERQHVTGSHTSALPETEAPERFRPKIWTKEGEPLIDPTYMRTQSDYHFSRAEAYSLDGQYEKAIEEFKSVLVYDPNSQIVHMRLSTEYVKLGMVSAALESAKKAVSIDEKNVEARLLHAGLLSSLRMYESALEEYKAIVKLDPDNLEAPLLIGAVYAEKGDFDNALASFQKLVASKQYKTKHLGHYYLGRLYIERNIDGDLERALTEFKLSLKTKPDFEDSIVGVAEVHEARGQHKLALKVLEDFQTDHGPFVSIAKRLSRTYLSEENYEKAYEQIVVLENFNPRELNHKVKLALVLIELKRFREAVNKLEEVLYQAPESDKIRFYLSAVYEELGEYDSAIANFKKIPPISTYYPESIVHWAYLLRMRGEVDEALTVLNQGIETGSMGVQAYSLAASIYDQKGEFKSALGILKEAEKNFAENPEVYFYLGSVYDKMGQQEKTISSMIKVLELDDRHVQAMNYLAYTYADRRENLDKAEALARRALALEPEDGYIIDTLGWVLFRQGKYSDAIAVLELAYSKQPQEPVIAEHLGDAYLAKQMPEKAKKMYEIALGNENNKQKVAEIEEKILATKQQIDLASRQPASVNE
jgi:tetratricopeptide (TPR) repeat protein